MDLKPLLFSSRGRINRTKFWLTNLACYAVFMVVYIPFALTLRADQQTLSGMQFVFMAVIVMASVVFMVISVMLGIKRFHDRGKSGFWVLIQLVPIIGAFWYLIECGFLRGTPGQNQFGPDPLASSHDDIAQVFGGTPRQTIR